MKKVISTILLAACGMSLIGCTAKQSEVKERPDLFEYKDEIHALQIELTCLKEAESTSGTVIEVKGVKHRLRSYPPSLYGSIAAQSEACTKICEHVVEKIEKVADRCGEEIDAELEKSILEHTEKELLHIVRPELVCVEYGDDHIPDSRGNVTQDIRFYCSATMHQPVAPIAQWLVSIGNSQQRQKLLKIVNEIFEINKNGVGRKAISE